MMELRERLAEALCVGQGLSWEDQADPMKSANGDDCREAFRHDAEIAIQVFAEWLESEPDAHPVLILLSRTIRGE